MGDAAHAMVPHQGQGANQTIEDAIVLADCLAGAGDLRPRCAPTRSAAASGRRGSSAGRAAPPT